ncbi:MAG: tetratricopeptide repeat protein [Vicinamibacteria bacterium]
MGEVDWGPAVAFLAAGIVLGAVILWRFAAQSRPAPAEDSLEKRDLLARLDALVSQLREIDLGADRRAPEQREADRLALELSAARVLSQIEALSAPVTRKARKAAALAPAVGQAEAPAAAPEAPAAAAAPPSAMKGFAWGVGSAAAIGLVLFLVSQSARERGTGGSVTGDTPGMGGAPAPAENSAASDAEVAAAQARVQASPGDVEARLELARLQLMRQDMMSVFTETQVVLEKDPKNARALAYQSLVRLAMGQPDKAEAMLQQAIESDPGLIDGYIHLMLVYTRVGRAPEAEKVLASASRRFPDRAEGLRGLLAELRQAANEEPVAPAPEAEDPHAGVPVPGQPGGATAPAGRTAAAGSSTQAAAGAAPGGTAGGLAGSAAGAPAGRSVSGVLELDPSARAAFKPGAIVYVILRESGFGAGQPAAVLRLVASAFPLKFEVGQANSMSGEPVPDPVLIEARLDADGDPVTRPPSDPYGREDHVKLGRSDVRIVLKPRS